MLDDGRIIYDGGLDELKNRWSKGREIQFQFAGQASIERLMVLTSGLSGVTGAQIMRLRQRCGCRMR